MKIFIGADHRGYKLKEKITTALTKQGHTVVDLGTDTDKTSCDYPKLSYAVAKSVAKSPLSRGVLVCMSGIGHSIAANKIKGIRAALCYSISAAKLSRQHNNANILVLGAKFVPAKSIMPLIKAWLKEPFEGGRHLRRVKQITTIEKGRKP